MSIDLTDPLMTIPKQPGLAPDPTRSPTNVALDSMDQITSQDSPWMRSAARRGAETANARGVMNSSIAAGTAQREATDASLPIFNEAMGLNRAREGQAFQSRESGLDRAWNLDRDRLGNELGMRRDAFGNELGIARDRVGNELGMQRDQFGNELGMARDRLGNELASGRDRLGNELGMQRDQFGNELAINRDRWGNELAINRDRWANEFGMQRDTLGAELDITRNRSAAETSDWLNSNNFTREFNGQLSMLPIRNAMDLTNAISRLGMDNPEVYTPAVISGMTTFFTQNSLAMLQQFFPNLALPTGTP